MHIEIEVKNVYGESKVYPICETAKLFAQIAGTTTLTHKSLCLIERMGYEIKNVTARPTWKEVA